MKIVNYLFLAVCWGTLLSSPAAAISKPAKVTLMVVDEQGLFLEGAEASVGFRQDTKSSKKSIGQKAIVGADGRFMASGDCNSVVTYGAIKEGYYDSFYKQRFTELSHRGWEPWNPELKVVMRKIGNQVPMYIRDTKMYERKVEIPVIGKDVGFDLIAYDWLPPYGNGQHADFVFHLRRRYVQWNDQNSILTVTFSNESDGLLSNEENLNYGSVFKLPRFAPDESYRSKIELRIDASKDNYKTNIKQTNNYIFRVRAKKDEGRVVVAMYGKILGPIDFSSIGSKTAIVTFKYYLNPDGTRNLEHNPNRNLFYE